MANREQFLACLAETDFHTRFYALVAETAGQVPLAEPGSPAAPLAASGHRFTFVRNGAFWRLSTAKAADRFTLHLAIARWRVEPILNLVASDGSSLGGPFALLAATAAQLALPGFRHDPPYPKIIYTSESGLTRLATALVGMAQDARTQGKRE